LRIRLAIGGKISQGCGLTVQNRIRNFAIRDASRINDASIFAQLIYGDHTDALFDKKPPQTLRSFITMCGGKITHQTKQ